MSKNKIVKLISIWKRKPKKYKLKLNQIMVEVIIDFKGQLVTRHLAVDKNHPILI